MRIFRILIEMNKKSVSSTDINPFIFEENAEKNEENKKIAKGFMAYMSEDLS
jgi:hypothetical protein